MRGATLDSLRACTHPVGVASFPFLLSALASPPSRSILPVTPATRIIHVPLGLRWQAFVFSFVVLGRTVPARLRLLHDMVRINISKILFCLGK